MTTTATRPAGQRPRAAIAVKTLRTDRWWAAPLLTVTGLTLWVLDATVRAFTAITLPFLLLFRLTCDYYRRAYYRSFWLSPPACAVPDGHRSYSGETRFPLIFQNAHRYFFYAAVL